MGCEPQGRKSRCKAGGQWSCITWERCKLQALFPFILNFLRRTTGASQETDGNYNLLCVTKASGSVCVAVGKLLPLCALIFSVTSPGLPIPFFFCFCLGFLRFLTLLFLFTHLKLQICRHLGLLGSRLNVFPQVPLSGILGKWGGAAAEKGSASSGWVSVNHGVLQGFHMDCKVLTHEEAGRSACSS